MKAFEYYNPVKIEFGNGKISTLPQYISPNQKVLLIYGGGSIKKNGVYDEVKESLKDYDLHEFGGIEANPHYETCMKAITYIRANDIDFCLAVGGGSVIDATKFIVAGAHFEGEPWDIIEKGLGKSLDRVLPYGNVLTLPATGSETNTGAVITKAATKEKKAFGGPKMYAQFSILDPRVIASLPPRQLANGVIDAFTHTLEQYLTYKHDAILQDRIAEGILSTLIEIAPKVMSDPSDYKAASNLMWSCTMALNGLLRLGVPTDWATHMIGHELTAKYGIDHARTLAIIGPNLYEAIFEDKKEKLAQMGNRVFGLSGSEEEVAKKCISSIRSFYQGLGVDTKISDYADPEGIIPFVTERFKERKWTAMGERGSITIDKVSEILEMSY